MNCLGAMPAATRDKLSHPSCADNAAPVQRFPTLIIMVMPVQDDVNSRLRQQCLDIIHPGAIPLWANVIYRMVIIRNHTDIRVCTEIVLQPLILWLSPGTNR